MAMFKYFMHGVMCAMDITTMINGLPLKQAKFMWLMKEGFLISLNFIKKDINNIQSNTYNQSFRSHVRTNNKSLGLPETAKKTHS